MKIKVRYILIALLVLVLSLYFTGYRFTPRQAAKAHSFLERGAKIVKEVDVDFGHAYIYKSSDSYITVMVIKKGFLWKAPVSSYVNDVDIENDKIKTIGWMSYVNNEKEKATVLVIENNDEKVSSIEAGKETHRSRRNIENGKIATFIWDEALFIHDIKPIALSKDNIELYRYGYPLGTTTFIDKDLKWHSIN